MPEKHILLETRRRLYELLQEYPGLHMRELSRRCDIPIGNLKYHVDYLLKNEVLVEVEEGDKKRLYVKDKKMGATERRVLGVLRNEISRGLIIFILLNPGAEYSLIKDNFDLKPSKLSYYLKKLIDKGIIERIAKGRSNNYKVLDPDLIAGVIITYRPTFRDRLADLFVEAWSGDE